MLQIATKSATLNCVTSELVLLDYGSTLRRETFGKPHQPSKITKYVAQGSSFWVTKQLMEKIIRLMQIN